jgi:hypothetical protein
MLPRRRHAAVESSGLTSPWSPRSSLPLPQAVPAARSPQPAPSRLQTLFKGGGVAVRCVALRGRSGTLNREEEKLQVDCGGVVSVWNGARWQCCVSVSVSASASVGVGLEVGVGRDLGEVAFLDGNR